jgi:DNA-binding HxlR family transcriptional regulator
MNSTHLLVPINYLDRNIKMKQEKISESEDISFPRDCPSRALIELIADKWKLLIIHCLAVGERRNGELKRAIEGISQKMLTQTLRELERDGFVTRKDYHELPPRVGYTLTPLGASLRDQLLHLSDWGLGHFDEIAAARAKFAR